MLDHEDLKWIATTSTELNSILQQISRYADLAKQHKGEYNYIELLGDRVDLASKRAQELFDHVTSRILAGATEQAKGKAALSSPPKLTVLKSPPAAAEARTSAKPKTSALSARSPKLQPKAPVKASMPPVQYKIENPKGNRELILVVEDEVEVANFAREILMDEGYKVILAHDGFEALNIYQQIGRQIGLVILDFFLPVMDGDAVFDELRALNPNVNAVLSSGFAEQSKLSTMLGHGLRGFIPKPYTRAKLLEQVRSTLDAARQTR